MSRRTLTLLAPLLALLFAAPAQADPFGFAAPSVGAKHGVKAAAPSAAALDKTVSELTGGLDASEVATASGCQARPGEATCFAKTLVERVGRERIHPKVAARQTFTQVFPARRTGIAPATAAGAPAAVAPGAGTPAWLQQAYDLTYLSQTAGGNATVGIVDAYDSPTAESDLATYRTRYGLPPCTTANGCFRKLNQNGGTWSYPAYDQGWAQEIALDLDAVSALCPNCKPIAGATGRDYPLRAADVGTQLVAVSTAGNADGSVSARSDRSAAVQIAAPRWKSLPMLTGAPGRVGDVLSIAAGTFTGPALTSDTTQMMRCTNVCAARGPANVNSYTVASGDLGAILRVRETAANAGGDTVVWSARYVGPILNAQSAAAVLKAGTTRLKNSKGKTLAVARLPLRAAARRAVVVRRAHRVAGRLIAWACPAALGTKAPRCSKKVRVRRSAQLRLPARSAGRVRVVVVKR